MKNPLKNFFKKEKVEIVENMTDKYRKYLKSFFYTQEDKENLYLKIEELSCKKGKVFQASSDSTPEELDFEIKKKIKEFAKKVIKKYGHNKISGADFFYRKNDIEFGTHIFTFKVRMYVSDNIKFKEEKYDNSKGESFICKNKDGYHFYCRNSKKDFADLTEQFGELEIANMNDEAYLKSRYNELHNNPLTGKFEQLVSVYATHIKKDYVIDMDSKTITFTKKDPGHWTPDFGKEEIITFNEFFDILKKVK